ncbi:MAG: EAL domain-containing protein [Agarilytica sp.]
MSKDSDDDGLMEFLDEDQEGADGSELTWRVLIIDDEKDVHSATTFALRNTEVVGRSLEFLHATSAREAKTMLMVHKDIAVILLDVVMETPNAGLDLVPTIRDDLDIKDTRIILRTGQPNQAPEIEVIRDYDINDYKLKSELTQARLFASLTTAIRSYKQIKTIEAGKKSLAMIVESSAKLLTEKGLQEFAQGVITHLSGLLSIAPEGLICARRKEGSDSGTKIIAAAGHFQPLMNRSIDELDEEDIQNCLIECLDSKRNIYNKNGIALYLGSEERGDMACFVCSSAEIEEVDESLLELFCSNITICADNLGMVTQLNDYAYSDELTALPNRNALVDHVSVCIERGEKRDHLLCMIDIDNFAELNASLGQAYGDSLLQAVAARLKEKFPAPNLVARVFGDSFAIFGPPDSIDQDGLVEFFNEPFTIEGDIQSISVTAGVVPISEVDGDGEEAVKDATIVLKTAKKVKSGQVLFFRHNMVQEAQQRLSMLRHLRQAFNSNELYMVYQPKLRLGDLAVTGFESLIRWKDKLGNMVSPEVFIPLAERSGLIVPLGAWILNESLLSLKELHKRGYTDRHISVNLSVAQLQHPQVLNLLSSSISSTGVDPKYVNLEITESLAISDLEATVKLLNDIKKMGFTLSLDDFGTGYSSLNHLHKLPIDYLKLDRSLIEASDSPTGREIMEMIVTLAGKIGLEVVAEGVETRKQIEFLQSLNCDHAQGFYYAKPMAQAELLTWLETKANKDL